ncbi:MAG: uracil-DNA glycosylase [Rickettsiales bacterium]|nr:uracil-DNA glycosylase [Rickettsiales bacterium]
MYKELDDLKNVCQRCTDCGLYKTRSNVVFSDGIPNDKLMLIGEAPGYWEDVEGKPFVGKSGQLLDKILKSIGIAREQNIYICNVIKCRPPDNRNPNLEEQLACKKYLDLQISIIKPKIILLCGAIAAKCMLDTTLGITKIRGQWFDGPHGSKMIPIFHPAYLLRNGTRAENGPKWLTWKDCQKIKEKYDQIGILN